LVLLAAAYFFFVFACPIWTRKRDLWPTSRGRRQQAIRVAGVSLVTAAATVVLAGLAANWSGAEVPAAMAVIFGAPVALAPLAAGVRLIFATGIDEPTGTASEPPDEARVRVVVLAVAGAVIVLAVGLVVLKGLPSTTWQSWPEPISAVLKAPFAKTLALDCKKLEAGPGGGTTASCWVGDRAADRNLGELSLEADATSPRCQHSCRFT